MSLSFSSPQAGARFRRMNRFSGVLGNTVDRHLRNSPLKAIAPEFAQLILFPKLPADLLTKKDVAWVKEWEQLK